MGGRTSVRGNTETPTWYRIFLPSVILFLVLLGLGTLLWTLGFASAKPILVAWAVTDYRDPAVPINEFAFRDVQKILKSTSFSRGRQREEIDSSNLQEVGGFRTFFEGELPTIRDETLVVYLSAQGASRTDGGYLLTAGSTADAARGYELSQIVGQMAQSPARHKLLILDISQIARSLELGMLGNDVIDHLHTDFEQATRELPDDGSSFWVVASSDRGQSSWGSRELGHTTFGLAVAYGLRGGSAVDQADERGRKDGYLSASELTSYLQTRVAGWAARYRDNAVQHPLCLKHGPDFLLIRVDDRLTESNLLAETVDSNPPSSKAKEEAKKEAPAPEAAAATGEAPKEELTKDLWPKKLDELQKKLKPIADALAPPAEGKPPNPPPDDGALVDSIIAFWTLRDEWLLDVRSQGRAHERAAFELELMQAEKLLLARQNVDAGRTLVGPVFGKFRGLARPRAISSPLMNWSLAFTPADPKSEPYASADKAVSAYLEEPKDRATIANLAVVEARMLDLFTSSGLAAGGTWRDRDQIRSALAARRNAERACRLGATEPQVMLLGLLRAQAEAADNARRDAELALATQHADEATLPLRLATNAYDEIIRETDRLAQSIGRMEKVTGELLSYVRWLGADLTERENRAADVALLESVIDSIGRLQLNDSTARSAVHELASLCEKLESRGLDYAESAWRSDSWRQTVAALELPGLPAERRRRLLDSLIETAGQEPPLSLASRSEFPMRLQSPASPYPLASFVKLLGGKDELIADLRAMGPLEGSTVTLGHVLNEPEARIRRADTGARVRELLSQQSDNPREVEGNPFATRLLRRMTAPLRALSGSSAIDADRFFLQQDEEWLRSYLRWQADRIRRDNESLPGQPFRETLKLVVETLRAWDPTYRVEVASSSSTTLESPSAWSIGPAGTGEIVVKLRVNASEKGESPKRFVLDWHGERSRLDMTSSMGKSEPGRLTVELPSDPAGGVWSIPLQLNRKTEQYGAIGLGARLEYESGRREWIPIELTFESPVVKPVDLIVRWPDDGDRKGVLEMYPNDELDLSIILKKNAEGEAGARVEFLGGGGQPVSVAMALTKEMMGEIPLAVPRDLALPLDQTEEGSRLLVRLYVNNEAKPSHEVSIPVVVLNAEESFEAEIRPEQRELVASVRRIDHADGSRPVPISLTVEPASADTPPVYNKMPSDADSIETRLGLSTNERNDYSAFVSVAQTPRTFRFNVTLQPPRGVVRTDPSLSFVSPREHEVFKFDPRRETLPLSLQADGPSGVELGEFLVRVGVDARGDGRLDGEDAPVELKSQAGRTTSVLLMLRAEGSRVSLQNVVKDLTVDLRGSWGVGRKLLRSEFTWVSRRLEAMREVFVLQEAPRVTIESPIARAKFAPGKTLGIVVTPGDSYPEAIDSLEFGFDKNGNNRWDADETVAPVDLPPDGRIRLKTGGDARVQLPIPKDLLGRTFVMARSRVSFVSEPGKEAEISTGAHVRREIDVVESEMMEPAKPTKGTIVGTVKIGSSAARNAKVILEGFPEQTTDSEGKFRIPDVPEGKHTVKASMTAPFAREGKAEVTVVPGKDNPVDIPLSSLK